MSESDGTVVGEGWGTLVLCSVFSYILLQLLLAKSVQLKYYRVLSGYMFLQLYIWDAFF